MLAIRLSDEIESRLNLLAKQTGRTKTFYAREAILTHLDDLEDYYLSAETVARVRRGDEVVHWSGRLTIPTERSSRYVRWTSRTHDGLWILWIYVLPLPQIHATQVSRLKVSLENSGAIELAIIASYARSGTTS